MAYSLEMLVRELGARRGDLALATAEATGDRMTLVARDLESSLPVDYSKLYCWVFGSPTAEAFANRGQEVRATGWDHATKSLALMEPGFPDPATGGIYEVHFRSARAQKVRAINAALRLLFLHWSRPMEEETIITTVAGQTDYEITFELPVATVAEVAVELLGAGGQWADAAALQPRLVREVSAHGIESNTLRFGVLPPAGRRLRVRGELTYEEAVDSGDVVPLDGAWGGVAFEWIMAYASMCLADWDMARQVSHEAQIAQAISRRELEKQRGLILMGQQAHLNAPILVPSWSAAGQVT